MNSSLPEQTGCNLIKQILEGLTADMSEDQSSRFVLSCLRENLEGLKVEFTKENLDPDTTHFPVVTAARKFGTIKVISHSGQNDLEWIRIAAKLLADHCERSALGSELCQMKAGGDSSSGVNKKIQQDAERFQMLLRYAPVMIDSFDSDGRCIIWNRECERQLGWTAEEVMASEDPLSLCYSDEEQKQIVVNRIQNPDGKFREYSMPAKSGDIRHQLWADFKLPIGGLISIGYDVTEYRKNEQEKQILKEQLHQAQKMESIGRLAGGVAHDFNNMLSVIMGNAELVLDYLDSSHPLYHEVQEIKEASDRSSQLTRQLLGFARKQTVSPQVIDLRDILQSMSSMIQRVIGKHIKLRWSTDELMWKIYIDPMQLNQILINLCVNAREAIDTNGNIDIKARNVQIDQQTPALHPVIQPGRYVLLEVADTGCGMNQTVKEKIFEPFFTTRETGKGTGLGLATVYGIVKQNNGYIFVDSECSAGSVFSIYLPIYIDKTKLDQKDLDLSEVTNRPPNILVVEDEPAILNLCRRMLEKSGYKVYVADKPSIALKLAEDCEEPIDLVISDVVLPEMNGRELAGKILTLYPDTKFLFMSGYSTEIKAFKDSRTGASNFIRKPFTRKDLLAKLHVIMETD